MTASDAFTHASPTYQNAQRGCVRDRRIPIINGDDLGPLPDPRAANDNDASPVGDHNREPSNFGLVVVLIAIVGIGMACIGAIR